MMKRWFVQPAHNPPMWFREPRLPNGLELSRSAEAGGAPHTIAPAGDDAKSLADSAEPPGRHLDSPRQ
jgi:hypothetical protein